MSVQEFDLGHCLERIRRNDHDAARALVEELYPLVIRIVRSHLPERSAEEDLAQEIFLKLFSKLGQYEARVGIPFQHWVSRLAVRTCLDALRSRRRRPEVRWSDLPEPQQAWLDFLVADDSAAPDSASSSAREVVEKLLAQLSPPDRLVISLLDLEEKSVAEVARVTGWNVQLVKVRACRARRKLRKLAQVLKVSHRYEEL
jgi:RNA polymerase sigma factor (sigma-70 family)